MKSDQPFVLSIEPVEGSSFKHGFHLGTDERVARQIAIEMFDARNANAIPTRTVALFRYGKMLDVYDGAGWTSDADPFLDE
jgi:hypothetical protein